MITLVAVRLNGRTLAGAASDTFSGMPDTVADKHRVVILGGGFGGLAAAQTLKSAPAQVTLIDRRNFHLFQPLMYQVATGSLSPGEIAAPLRSILNRQQNTEVLLGEAADIDPAARQIILADGSRVPYDSLVVATGSHSFYFGRDEWREQAPSLKGLEEALLVRHKIFAAFEAAERLTDARARAAWLTFVIVGAGATGVELAGALAEIAHQTLRHDFHHIHSQDARIVLIDGAPRVLPTFPEDLSEKARHSLDKMRVEIRTGVNVVDIDADGVAFAGPGGREHLPSKTVLWAGGIAASGFAHTLAVRLGAPTDNRGRIKVSPDLTIPGHPKIFIVGDLATANGPDGRPLPGLAPVAMQQGRYVSKVIADRLRGRPAAAPFRYLNKGDLAVIGRAAAVADIFGLHLWGWPAWWVWVLVHLMYLVEFQSRIVVFVHWAFQYLTFSHGARLITGIGAPEDTLESGDEPRSAAPKGKPRS
jgi:NADH dehydrogenase